MPLHTYNRGPWYRGGVPRSYVAPSVFASVGCGACLGAFSIFFMISGGAMIGISTYSMQEMDKPPFDDPFFKKHRENQPNIPGIVKTVGTVFLAVGCIMFFASIIMCVVVAYLAKKQENKRHAAQQNPLTSATPQPPPPSAYPHQTQIQGYYPPPGSYPAQPVGSDVPMQSQYQYPPQPTSYPPTLSGAPPPGIQYPPPSYAPNVPPQTTVDAYKQPLE